ncbi:non-ribosomal peptide synthetase/type I polyketide synthase [Spirosoma utsteinense]|uniref:non-ribosomal peptide synthetase/type I polyketide synthase n=1 Tax=Spirosoma utsteinense TaxID=2585773 RepID=UPI001645FA15|nr:non-ribosomal peptide synthetase/type I polyketide synthase [Spirosoma utsteinense]
MVTTFYPENKTVVDLIAEQVRNTPDNVAVVFEDQQLTYRELDAKSNQLANYLRKHGVEAEVLVPICTNRSLKMIIGIVGILKAGGAYVPIDPEYPKDRIEYLLSDIGANILLTDSYSAKLLTERREDFELIDIDKNWAIISKESVVFPKISLMSSNLAYVIYTSGSTGLPKGVMIEHQSVVNEISSYSKIFGFNSTDKQLVLANYTFDASVEQIFVPLISGACVVLISKDDQLDPDKLDRIIEEVGITHFQATPSFLRGIKPRLYATLKRVCSGGETCSTDLAEQWSSYVNFFNKYGPTEATVNVSYHLYDRRKQYEGQLPIGKPLPNTQLYILDASDNPVAVGLPGELHIGGIQVARGYLNKSELTSEKFIVNPFGEIGSRLYKTGDLARWLPDGNIEYLGRIDNQVKIRGYRVELGEIETILSQHLSVRQSVVVAKDDGTGGKRLVAYVVPEAEVATVAITQYLKSKLPDHMIPSSIVRLPALPLTLHGKIDRESLLNASSERPELAVPYKVPKTTTEKQICMLWASLLQLDRVGINDDFFELGGNSLLAMKAVSSLQEVHNYRLPIASLYQSPTVEGIARFLEGRNENNLPLATQKRTTSASVHEIAVIGMAGRFPGANTIDELWDVLKDGKETIRFFSDQELDSSISQPVKDDANYVKARGVIDKAEEFDAFFFGINPKMAELMDPQQRVFLEVAWEALEDAGYTSEKYNGSIGVFAGCRFNSYYQNNVASHPELIEKVGLLPVMTYNDKDYISSRTAYTLNLKGPAVTVQSACSTSLLAIAQAVESIRASQCTMALAGGAIITAPVNSGHMYQEGAMLSNDGHCRAFDADAKGTVFSDGAGAVLLKSRKQAEEDGDFIYAIIKGVGVNNDGGNKASFTAPSSEGQAEAIKMAIADADVSPSSISYVEAHGTATPLGDPIEIEGLKKAFGFQEKKQFCAVGSIKSNMGHLVTAAGVAGFIKTVMSLRHKQIPPSLFYKNPNPNIDFANSPFYVNTALTTWDSATIRRAGVSSFGVGGTNVHVVLEECQQESQVVTTDQPVTGRPVQLVTWSAKSIPSRDAYATRLANHLQQNSYLDVADVAFTLQTTRAHFNQRQFVLAATGDELSEKLLVSKVSLTQLKTVTELPSEVVFLFPGQGSQYLNMGRELYDNEPVYRQAVDECADLLHPYLDVDIRQIIYPEDPNWGADERLKNTRFTQPALFVTEYALARLWMNWGIEPSAFCGHSIGEFVAAHLAGVFTLADALKLIAIRGQLVSELPRGSMLSVRLEANKIGALMPEPLSIAAINSHKLCVVAGHDEDIAAFATVLDEQEIPNRVLLTSHAFHSAMMDPIVSDFEQVVRKVRLNRPQKPIVSSVSGIWLTDEQAIDPTYWAKHLRLTVHFADALDFIFTLNKPLLLEVGPGNAATTFAHQQAGSRQAIILTSLDKKGEQTDHESILNALGQTWLNGLEPNWKAFYADQRRAKVSLPTYAFDRSRYWVDPAPVAKLEAPSGYVHVPAHQFMLDTAVTEDSPHDDNMRKINILNRLKDILEDASGVELEGVRPETSFLEIGLDSLSMTQVALTLKKELGIAITFRQLNEEYATLNALVDYLDLTLPAEPYQPKPIAQLTAQPIAEPTTPVPVYVSNGAAPIQSQTMLDLMAKQLQILSQQVVLMQNGGLTSTIVTAPLMPSPVLSNNKPISPGQAELNTEENAEIKKPFGAGARIERQATELTPQQQEFLAQLTQRYTSKTAGSKAYTQEHRPYMADPRAVTGFRPLTKEIVYPIVVDRSKGSRLWDIDGNEYIDILSGFGSNMLGYQPQIIIDALVQQATNGYEIGPQHVLAGEVCKLLCEFTGFDRAALCSTGSEAVLGAMRIARTVTNRSLIVAFTGSYHGIVDEVVVRGSKKLKSFPAAPGIMPEAVQNMLILDYGTDESLRIIRERAGELAAVLVEPVQSRRPEFRPVEFMKQLRTITAESGITLIFDEMITGFRIHPGGAQAMFGIKADLATYGKVIAAGIPIGVIAGDKKFMDALDGGSWQYGDDSVPEAGVTYFAGTFVRHPLALATAKASLTYMKVKGPALQQGLNAKGERVANALNAEFERFGLPMYVAQFGSVWKIKYKEEIPYSELLFTLMREKGVHVWDGFACYITEAHTDAELDRVISLFIESTHQMMAAGFFKPSSALNPGTRPSADATRAELVIDEPPMSGAKLGRDPDGNPGWFMPSPDLSGRFQRVDDGDAIRSEAYLTVVDYNPFVGPEISHLAPITESQLEIWMACQLGGDDANRSYNESNSIHFRGPLSRPAMERAVHSLFQRHEALRSVFSANGEHIYFLAQPIGGLLYRDFSDETNPEQLVQGYVGREMQHVFDLDNGPLFRASLLRLSEDDHYLVLTGHHIIIDGWSTHVILQDLSKLYSAYYQGSSVELTPAPSYAQHAIEQAQFVKSEAYEPVEKFWISQYAGNIPILNLPTDRPRPATRTYQGHRIDYAVDPELVAAIKQMGVGAGTSFVMTLMAAFEVFLHRLTGQQDLVLGLPAAGQSFTGKTRMVGHFVNILPLRSHVKSDERFVDYLKQRKMAMFDAYEQQQITFGSLLKKLNLTRDPSRVPLVPVIFNIDMGKSVGVNYAGLTYQITSNPRKYENFELFLNVTDAESVLTLEWSYNTQLFKASTIDRLMREFEQLLRALVVDPSVRIDAVPVLYDPQRLAELAQWNQTAADYPREVALPQLIAQTATLYPAKTAVTCNGQQLSYQALDEGANQLAHYLVQRGIRVGDLIGVALDRSPDMLMTLLAIMKAGAAYIPLDPAYPQDRIQFMLADSAAKLLITSEEHSRRLASATAQVLLENGLAESAQCPKTKPDVSVSGDDLAYVLYTSGSTGKPKGVLVTHRNIVNLLWSMYAEPGIGPDDVLLAVTTISFDIAGLELYLPLITGATVALADAETAKDGRALVEIVREQPITLMQATPATYKMMLDADWQPPATPGGSALNILCCGEPMSKDLAQKLIPRCRTLWNMYGPTETTIYSTGKQILASDPIITIGRPIHNTQVYILDPSLRPVAEGIEGEIYLAGDGVAQGYLNRPELTVQRFVENPFGESGTGKMYRTGDLGKFLANGEILCLGRIDNQIKLRGYRIELGEIENTLNTFNGVKEAVVVAREDHPGDQRLVAYLVPESIVDSDEVLSWHDQWDRIYRTGEGITAQVSGRDTFKVEVEEWEGQALKRIRALNPKRIMEVGCGVGPLLFALAPDVDQYIGTDYAESAINTVQQKMAVQPERWQHVTVATAPASDFSLVKEPLDMVLMHSVAQYFPDVDYLLRVIKEATTVVAKGGCIFIGDMQTKSTLKMLHIADQITRSAPDTTLRKFKQVIDRRIFLEDEMMADTAFFYRLPELIPAIKGVDVQLREGKYSNEATKYHYDVWLYIGESPQIVNVDRTILWTQDYAISVLERELRANLHQVTELKGVANQRTASDYAQFQAVESLNENLSLTDMKQRIQVVAEGIDPDVFRKVGETLGFKTYVRWANDGTDRLFDVVFIPSHLKNVIPAPPAFPKLDCGSATDYVRNPFKADQVTSPEQIKEWKRQAKTSLPDYMVPTQFVVLAKLPLTPNGKIDRKALPAPDLGKSVREDEYVGPRNDLEKLVMAVWTDLLKLEKISVFENFFELGGHSLIALHVMIRLEKETGKRLPLAALLEHPTIEKLALLLQVDADSVNWDSLVPIRPKGSKIPLYIVHGAGLNVLLFNALTVHLDPEQPIFGLQAKGLNGLDEPLTSIEDIAAHYIDAITRQNPSGPYALAGYSSGGIIAYEMSRQLLDRGKEVKLLALFDTHVDQSNYFDPWLFKQWNNLVYGIKRYLYTFVLLKKDFRGTISYKKESIKRRVTSFQNKLKHREAYFKVLYGNNYKVYEANHVAARMYRFSPQEITIDLFRAKQRMYYWKDFEFLGWKPLALKGINIHEVPGDHANLFSPPNDKEVARVLQKVLNERL